MAGRDACLSVGAVFAMSLLVTLVFWVVLPDTARVNESTDYAVYYEPVARSILAGHGIAHPNGMPATSYPPGYPLLLAGLFGLSQLLNTSETTLLSAFSLVGMGFVSVLLFLLSRSVWGARPGIISAVVWMTYPLALWLTKQPGSEIPFMIVFYGALCLFWRIAFQKDHSWHSAFVCGLLVGAASLIRPIAIGIGFVLVALLWLGGPERTRYCRLLLSGALVLGNLLAILPWEAWVFNRTGNIVLLSTGGVAAQTDGLTFAVASHGYREGVVRVPPDVRALMRDLGARVHRVKGYGDVLSILAEQSARRPLAVVKLFAIKVARSLYATDSQRFETPLLLVQVPYLFVGVWSGIAAWKLGAWHRQLASSIGLMFLYFWGITVTALSIVRYMVPAMGLLLLLVPALCTRRLRN